MYGWEIRMLLKHYLDEGVSKTELSRRFGVNRRTIHNWVITGQLDRDLSAGARAYSPRPPVRWSSGAGSCAAAGAPPSIVAAAAGLDVASLGAWMAHGSFSLNAVRAVDEEVESDTLHALAPGNLTDRPLTGSATWLGITVGPPTAGDDRGDRLVGTAALN